VGELLPKAGAPKVVQIPHARRGLKKQVNSSRVIPPKFPLQQMAPVAKLEPQLGEHQWKMIALPRGLPD
jgi:hypothetical protein